MYIIKRHYGHVDRELLLLIFVLSKRSDIWFTIDDYKSYDDILSMSRMESKGEI